MTKFDLSYKQIGDETYLNVVVDDEVSFSATITHETPECVTAVAKMTGIDLTPDRLHVILDDLRELIQKNNQKVR